MVLIHIRGTNGTGKSTIVRQFVQKNNLEIRKVKIKNRDTYICTDEKNQIVVLGRYDRKTGGCDAFDGTEHVLNTILWSILNLRPQVIVFEGVIYGLSYNFSCSVSDLVKNYNYKYVAISLYVKPELVLNRIYKRNGGKEIKEYLVLNKIKSVIRSHRKLVKNGYNSKLIDVSDMDEKNMYEIIENELRNQLEV